MAKSEEHQKTDNYKFKELKVYSSTEWLANNKKKYRQVFDRFETTYIYAELSFFNKLFDEEVWEVNVSLCCYNINNRKKPICKLEFTRKVSKYDNVVYVREGWGNKKDGGFWKKGSFVWEASIEGEKVGSKYFYIEDVGQGYVKGQNPYLELSSLKLYEGQYDDVSDKERNYLKSFSADETRYIYAELSAKNLNIREKWHSELFIKFYNESRELKGEIVRLQSVNPEQEIIKANAGWGSNAKGSWRSGNYTVEVIFMDRLLAVIPFEIGEEFEEGLPVIHRPGFDDDLNLLIGKEESSPESFEEVLMRLDELIGLHEIKKKVKDHAQYIQFLKLRKEKGFEEKEAINIHSVFTGNPGTGKTTVAKMMGLLYKKMGLLKKGHVHEVDRVDLVGEYIGQTAPKVKEAIEKARGGVLFIDEAYALARANDDSKDFGREVIEILVKEMSAEPRDFAIIVAGYPKEMKHFIDSNPGLRSRFKQFFEFRDYLPQELTQIASYACEKKEVVLSEEAATALKVIITDAYRTRTKAFGNARYVYDLVEKAKVNMGLRIMSRKNPDALPVRELEKITLNDVNKIEVAKQHVIPDIPIDEKLLELALAELHSLIGIDNIKKQIEELVNIVRFYRESGKSVISNFFLHTVFVGNPGTGKTTVARILTKIYKAIGILERGQMVETDRQGLIAGFVGQTAIKTSERIDEAIGGVLFIDEAYALSNFNGLQGDYGNEAIQTLLKRMEDNRGEFFVFVAGYPSNMEPFLKANPGLSSRFDKTLKFEDYNPDQLTDIAFKMFQDEGVRPNAKALEFLRDYFKNIYLYRDKFFGNARTVRKVVSEAIKNQNLRLAKLPIEERNKTKLRQITYDDVAVITTPKEEDVFTKSKIGFKAQGE